MLPSARCLPKLHLNVKLWPAAAQGCQHWCRRDTRGSAWSHDVLVQPSVTSIVQDLVSEVKDVIYGKVTDPHLANKFVAEAYNWKNDAERTGAAVYNNSVTEPDRSWIRVLVEVVGTSGSVVVLRGPSWPWFTWLHITLY